MPRRLGSAASLSRRGLVAMNGKKMFRKKTRRAAVIMSRLKNKKRKAPLMQLRRMCSLLNPRQVRTRSLRSSSTLSVSVRWSNAVNQLLA